MVSLVWHCAGKIYSNFCKSLGKDSRLEALDSSFLKLPKELE